MNDNLLFSGKRMLRCGLFFFELAVFCTDTEQLPVAPLIVRRTGRVFGRSCPALLFRGTSPRLRKATRKLLCRIGAWSCTACNFFLFSCQGAFGAVCSVDGATIAGAVSIIPEKNLRTVFCPQLFSKLDFKSNSPVAFAAVR